MRGYIGLAAAVALALIGLPAASPSADDNQTGSAVLDNQEAQGILGKEVRSTAGEDMGRLVDVIVDRTGQARAAVIDFGGFLGVGSRKIVVDWGTLRFTPGEGPERITVDLTRNQVRSAPEYRSGKPVVVMGALEGRPPAMPER